MSKIETVGAKVEVPQMVNTYVGYRPGIVIVDFHQSISAMELGPEAAEMLARAILKHARNARETLQRPT